MTSITFNGQEVQSPALRFLVTAWVAVLVFIFLVVLMLVWPVLVPLHFLLKALGRQGFAQRSHPDSKDFRIYIGPKSFSRR